MSVHKFNQPANRLLAALPPEEYQSLLPHLEPVELPQHQVLYYAGDEFDYAYFPSYSLVSSVAIMENGSTTEIGVIGNDGMVGLPILLGTGYTNYTVIVQVGDGGYRISAKRLQEVMNCHELVKRLLMRYVQARITQIAQTAACNRHHTIEQRFARWLLLVRDSIQQDEFKLTQEFISQMLGVRRTGVTEVASKFQRAGIISYKRGLIRIISARRLEACTCECYQLIYQQFSSLIKY